MFGGGLLVDFWPSPWSLNDALVCRGVPQACHTLLARCGPFDTSLDGRWASPQPLEVRSKGKSGGVCRVHFRRLSALSWSLNDALGCCGVFEACLTLLAHCGPFGASFEGRWASPRPSKIGFKGKSGGVCGVSFCQLSALSWSLNDTLGCQGASTACHILWSHRGPFDASLKKRWASLKPLEVRFKGKSGGVCGVPFRRLSALSWSLNDALVCLGMSRACHTFLKHHGLVFCVSGWTFSVTMDLGSPVLR